MITMNDQAIMRMLYNEPCFPPKVYKIEDVILYLENFTGNFICRCCVWNEQTYVFLPFEYKITSKLIPCSRFIKYNIKQEIVKACRQTELTTLCETFKYEMTQNLDMARAKTIQLPQQRGFDNYFKLIEERNIKWLETYKQLLLQNKCPQELLEVMLRCKKFKDYDEEPKELSVKDIQQIALSGAYSIEELQNLQKKYNQ